jgi:hypothetical protein
MNFLLMTGCIFRVVCDIAGVIEYPSTCTIGGGAMSFQMAFLVSPDSQFSDHTMLSGSMSGLDCVS